MIMEIDSGFLKFEGLMPDWLKQLFEKFSGKLHDPQRMLESTYQNWQSELIDVRQQCAQAIATEVQLERKLADTRITPEDTARLESELINQKAATQALKLRLATVESEFQKIYTKKQVWIAKQRAENASFGSDPYRATLVIIAIMTVWALVGVFLNLKSHY